MWSPHGIEPREGAELSKRASVCQRSSQGAEAPQRSVRAARGRDSLPRHLELTRTSAKGSFSFTEGSCGNCIPEFGFRAGCAFRFEAAWESAARNFAELRDALSGWACQRKTHPSLLRKNGARFSAAYFRRTCASRRAISGPPARAFLPLLRHFVDRSVACPHARVYSKRYFSYAMRCRFDLRDSKGAVMERILGVNLSGWFIPEPWVTPSLYAATGASNAAELQEAMGTAAYNERMRRHYETFVSEDDFRRMAQIGLNAVRLPVPWYAFGSQESDASYISVVDYIDRAIEWAAKYNIRVLLDLATVPGGQGDSNDSPTTPEAVAEWHSSTNGRHVALDVLERLADRYGEAESLLGIELLDTPQMSVRKSLFTMTDGIPAHYLRNFYRDAYELVRSYMPEDKIVVFSSSGHPGEWKHFMRGAKYKNVYMDLHLYHYRDEYALDITSPRGLTTAISRNKRELKEAVATGFPVLVGEWSGAAIFANSSVTPEGRNAYERVFIANQLASFAPAAGWFFQTWKTEKRIAAWDARAALGTLERGMIE